MTLIQQRHDIQELNTKRDKLRSKSYHLRDVNRNLQLEYGALFDSDKMQVLSERLGMVEPSLADGNLFYWEEKHESAAVYAAAKIAFVQLEACRIFCRFAAYRFNGGRFGPLAAKRFYARTTK